MRLVLTEKPSVAKDIAKGLGKAVFEKDHIKCGEYVIVWAYGHLLEIDDGVAGKTWSLQELPIFPEKFRYKATNKHFWTLKEFIQKAKEVIVATDAGREGELIARLILLQSGWKGWDRTYRLWTSSALTPEVVRKELKNLKPIKDFDSLYWSALARQHADWLVGINLTRAVSLKAGSGVWSVGRVQTPTLALVVQRTLERENFKPEPYFLVKAIFSKEGKSYEGLLLFRPDEAVEDLQEDKGRLSEAKAKEIVKELEGLSFGKVEKVLKKIKKEPPPKLYSLTSLQRRANELFGWSASKTLAVAQKLYEELKCISYPRTDAEYLSEANKELVREVMKKLRMYELLPKVEVVGKRVFDDSKLTDHHAIIPLDRLPEGARSDEEKLYSLIVKRFKAVFMDDYVYETVKVFTSLGRYVFVSLGKRTLSLGWRKEEGLEDKEQDLSFLKEGENVQKEKLYVQKKFTQPPPAYTEGSLLKEMERLGLGTPATRASIIDTLKDRGYVVMHKKALVATRKGKSLVAFLQGSKLVSAEMTSEWERKLEGIYRQRQGREGYTSFVEGIKDFVKEQLESVLDREIGDTPPMRGGKRGDQKGGGKKPSPFKGLKKSSPGPLRGSGERKGAG